MYLNLDFHTHVHLSWKNGFVRFTQEISFQPDTLESVPNISTRPVSYSLVEVPGCVPVRYLLFSWRSQKLLVYFLLFILLLTIFLLHYTLFSLNNCTFFYISEIKNRTEEMKQYIYIYIMNVIPIVLKWTHKQCLNSIFGTIFEPQKLYITRRKGTR